MFKPDIAQASGKDFPEFLVADAGPGDRDFIVHCHYPRYIVEILGNLKYKLHCIDDIPEKEHSWRVACAEVFLTEVEELYEKEAVKEAKDEEQSELN